jgi:ABC-type antimicrobial peptide transport system permease subunit
VPDRARFYQQLQERLAGLPAPATIVSHAPFEGGDSRWLASGAAAALRPQDRPIVRLVTIGTGYFGTLGTTLRRGRPFTSTDGAGGGVPAIVNERFVALHMPGLDPIGQQVTLTVPPGAGLPPRTVDVVGVAPDIRQRSTESAGGADAVVYVPYTGNPDPDANILVRSNASPGAVASLVREQLRQIDPDLPVFDIASFDDSLAASDERLGLLVFGSMIGVFAAVALTLATIGVYAVTAYAAARRTRELGLRMALGALPSQIRWLVTQTAVRQLTTGLTIGMAGSLAVGQLLQGVLIGTSSVDPVTFAAVIVLLVLVTFAASLAPARRATRLDPVAALRSE